MGFKYAKVIIILLVSASILAVGMANRNIPSGETQNWNNWFNHTEWFKHNNASSASQRIIVGGSQNWQFGFNYTDWALKTGPFYLNDTLVFKYDPPNGTNHPHSVYLLQNLRRFLKCDLRGAKRVADPTRGGGNGFEFVLKNPQPHFFSCGEKNGFHCDTGMMKFVVMPLPRRWHF